MELSAEKLLVSLKSSALILESQSKKRKNGGHVTKNRRPRRMLMKNRRRRVHVNGVSKRVRTLKKLVPNSESMGIESLFEETADYILSLQMRVRVMQIMVKVLSGSDDDQ
ncbi:Transcription factor UPBEAT1 [Euphorbia peplus]|nr:Transcription factor UPBEAT1 [Euphorbia peplus]